MVLGAAFALFFALRLIVFWIYWSDPAHHNKRIEPWMTPGYVARSHGLEQAEISAMLALPPDTPRGLTLQQLARMTGRDTATLIADLQRSIDQSTGRP